MSRLLQQVKNTGSLTIAKMLRPVFSFLLIKLIAATLGKEGHGQYTTVFNYIVIFEIIAAFGIKRLIAREVARDRNHARQYFFNAVLMLIPIALGAALVMSGLVSVLKWTPELQYAAWILAASLAATSLVECCEGVLIGYEKMHVVGIIWTLENFLRVLVSLLLVYNGFGLKSLVITYSVLKYAMLSYYLYYIFHFLGRPALVVNRQISRKLFSSARTFAVIVVFVTIYWKLDMLMLKEMKGVEAVGVYDGAYRFFGIIIVLISNFVLSVFPLFADSFRKNAAEFRKITMKTLKYFVILAAPLAGLLVVFSEALILRIFNAEYQASVPVLRILTFAVIPYGITEILAHMLLASDRQKADLVINGLGMAINMGLNFILIPHYSYIGAAAATLISIHVYLGIQLLYMRGNVLSGTVLRLRGGSVRLLLVTVVMIPVFWACSKTGLYASVLVPPLYYFLIWKWKIISEDDKRMIADLYRKITGKS